MKTVKTLVAVAFAALTLSLVGCSKDPEDLIIGSWEITSMTYSLSSSAAPDQPWTETYTPEEGESDVMTFRKDDTFTVVSTADGETNTMNGTYDVDDDKLTITYKDDEISFSETYTISNIDKKAMTLVSNESSVEDGVTYSATTTIELKKQ